MSHHFKETPENAITQSGIARVIPCKELDVGDPIKWLSLALRDAMRAPGLTLFYGVLFAVIPWFIMYLVESLSLEKHLISSLLSCPESLLVLCWW